MPGSWIPSLSSESQEPFQTPFQQSRSHPFICPFNLTTQAAQVACFRNVAAHLEPCDCFVIEIGVPGLQRLPPGETIRAFHVSETRWGFHEYDVAAQGLTSHHFEIVAGRVERLSVPFRYAWPSELDLMAHLAGMKLRER